MTPNEWMICSSGATGTKHNYKTFATRPAAETAAVNATRETGKTFIILEPVAMTSIPQMPVAVVSIPRPVEPKRYPTGFGPHGVW